MPVRRAAVGGETERGLGGVRRSRPDLEQQGATLRAPAARQQRAAELHAREVGVVGARGSRAARRAGTRALPWCVPRRAAPCRARAAGARARPRCAAAARPASAARRARACFASGVEGVLAVEAVEGGRGGRALAARELLRAELEQRRGCDVRGTPPRARGPRSPCPSAPRGRRARRPSGGRRTRRRCRARRRPRVPQRAASASLAERLVARGRPRGKRGRGAASCRCRGG